MVPALASQNARRGQHPVGQQAVHESLSEPQFQGLDQPPLRHVEHEDKPGDQEEHAQLVEKIMEVAARQRIIEGLVQPLRRICP